MFYSGIGSRQTPEDILNVMKYVATELSKKDYILRSGGAKGADSAFEAGAKSSVILRAKDATEKAIKLASEFHPAWDKCNDYVRKLHGRNAMIILGENLSIPSDFVICWTPEARVQGGTGLGINIALANNIPVYNLANKEDCKIVSSVIKRLK